MASEKVVIAYEKRGNTKNYIKETKYDMAVGNLLLRSFWANEAIFQLMMTLTICFYYSRWTSQRERMGQQLRHSG
jgi:hypothetical protein